ncbi:MAG: sensor domain-containing diguanylate cyclase [Elusimicrobiota bacterium]
MIINESRKRAFYCAALFAVVALILFENHKNSAKIIPFFVIPLSILRYGDFEIRFVFLSFIFFISLILPKIFNSGNFTVYAANFVGFLSVLFFSIAKNSIEKKSIDDNENIERKILEIKKNIDEINSKLTFYQQYRENVESKNQSRQKVFAILKAIQNSKNNDQIVEQLMRGLGYLFPESTSEFIISLRYSRIVEDVFKTKMPIFIPSIKKETRYGRNHFKEEENSSLYIPLSAFSNVIAVIKISSTKENYFTADDFRTAEMLVTTASITIENLSLYSTTEELARKDPLTGLFTHRVFQEKIDEEILVSARTKRPLSLVIIDIDHFKKINDTYGHQIGDNVLKGVSLTIKKAVREFDFIARYGGEEFAIILPQTPKNQAVEISKIIQKKIKLEVFEFENKKFSITVSMGIAEFPKEATSKSQLIRVADERLYRAKREGRDRIIYE